MAKEQDNTVEQQEVNSLDFINDADMMFLLEQAKRVDEESMAKIALIKNIPYSLIKEII